MKRQKTGLIPFNVVLNFSGTFEVFTTNAAQMSIKGTIVLVLVGNTN